MKVLYYDCFSGISGDMNLGAMVDIGVDKDYLIKELSKLNIEDEYEIKINRASRKGIEGTKVDIILHNQHDHEEGHHHHHHEHRNLHAIEHIIIDSELSPKVKELSINIFKRVAMAEAKIHGKTIDEVHFHEVGATDSILDIVGAAIAIDYLQVDKVISSSIELGGGFVRCAHGRFPVPAPATLEILKGIPVKTGVVPFETTTPTGAAILAEVVDEFTNLKNFVVEIIGYGVGNRDTEIPNVLRVIMGNI
jgi:uncharacterized protein (TIGR00299 family) protein